MVEERDAKVISIILAFISGMGNYPEPTMTIRPHSCDRRIGAKSTPTDGDRWPGQVEGNLNLDIIVKHNIVKADVQRG